MIRRRFYLISVLLLLAIAATAWFWLPVLWSLLVVGPLLVVGLHDSLQREHTVLRNFPIIGHIRYGLEVVRPEIQQYFIESNIDAYPIEREFRSLVYQRAKGVLETRAFGTQRDVYRVGYEWASHAVDAREPPTRRRGSPSAGPTARGPTRPPCSTSRQ